MTENEALYTTTDTTTATPMVDGATLTVYLVLVAFILAALWRVFTKAGKPGWAAIVPIYNYVVWLQIVGRPIWWVLLLFIPFVNVVVAVIIAHDLSKSFGRGVGMTLLQIFLPFIAYPLLAWGKATYQGPSVSVVTAADPNTA